MNSEEKALRAFVAIEVPEEIRTRLLAAQRELKAIIPAAMISWTKAENLHLTLRFLGNVATEKISELTSRLRTAVASWGELNLVCRSIGCFPNVQRPRIIWAGVADGRDRLTTLQRTVRDAVRDFAEKPDEARFTGHVTLARVKQISRFETKRLMSFVDEAAQRSFGEWPVREILLLRSQLTSVGSIYEELARLPLV